MKTCNFWIIVTIVLYIQYMQFALILKLRFHFNSPPPSPQANDHQKPIPQPPSSLVFVYMLWDERVECESVLLLFTCIVYMSCLPSIKLISYFSIYLQNKQRKYIMYYIYRLGGRKERKFSIKNCKKIAIKNQEYFLCCIFS